MTYKQIDLYILSTLLLFTSCSSKISNVISETNTETIIESVETGLIVGGILGHATGANALVTSVLGGAVGFGAGDYLHRKQLAYLEKENYLIKKINISIKRQQGLSQNIASLKENIVALNREVEYINKIKNKNIQMNKHRVLEKIELKERELRKLQVINNNAIDDALSYQNLLSYTSYSKEKKEKIESSVDSVLTSLFSLRKKCKINLAKLDQLKRKI